MTQNNCQHYSYAHTMCHSIHEQTTKFSEKVVHRRLIATIRSKFYVFRLSLSEAIIVRVCMVASELICMAFCDMGAAFHGSPLQPPSVEFDGAVWCLLALEILERIC
jgi:hypothetical protein